MKRYFFFAASYQIPNAAGTCNFGVVLDDGKFPEMDYMKKVVKGREKLAESIVILSICELSEADYKHLFGL